MATIKPSQNPKNKENHQTNKSSTSPDEIDLKSAFTSLPWVQDLNDDQIEALVRISKFQITESGEFLFHQGDKEDYLYILLEGRVAIEVDIPTGDRVVFYQAEPVDFIGWSSVTPVIRERTASARALIPSKLVAVDAIKLRELCDDDQQLGYVIMRRLANVIATRLLVTRMELIELLPRAGRQLNKPAPN